MKLVAAILAFLTLYLTAQEPVLSARVPAPEEMDCETEMSCSSSAGSCKKEEPAPQQEEKSSCCEILFCNPFGACCSYMPAERTLLTAASFLLPARIRNPFNENILSSYTGDIFQPPETVFPL